jgi:hypothetical protein
MWHSCGRYRVEDLCGPHSIGHYFNIDRPRQLDAATQRWVREAYNRGAQKEFERRGKSARRLLGTDRGQTPVCPQSDPSLTPV